MPNYNYQQLLSKFGITKEEPSVDEETGQLLIPVVESPIETTQPEKTFDELVQHFNTPKSEEVQLKSPSLVSDVISKMSPSRGDEVVKLLTNQQENPYSGIDLVNKARELSANSRLINELGRAGELIGSSIAGTKPIAQEAFKEQAKALEELPTQAKETIALKREAQKYDPNSEISKFYRDVASKFGAKIPETATASAMEKALPWIEKYYNARQIAEMRTLALKQAKEEKNERVEKEHQFKAESKAISDITKLEQKEVEAKKNVETAIALADEATKSPTAATNLARALIKAVEGPGSRVSDKDVQTALIAGGLDKRLLASLEKAKTGTIPTFQAQDVKRMMDVINTYHTNEFDKLKDNIATRLSKQTKTELEKSRDVLNLPIKKQEPKQETIRSSPQDESALQKYKELPDSDPRKQQLEIILRKKGLL